MASSPQLAGITLGGKTVYSPPPRYGRRINFFRMPTGSANYGVGKLLMLRSDYDSIVGTGGQGASLLPLAFSAGINEPTAGVTITVVVAGAEAAITMSAQSDTETDMVEVTVLDQRALNVTTATSGAGTSSGSYNVQIWPPVTSGSDSSKYYAETILYGAALTWSQIIMGQKTATGNGGSGIAGGVLPSWTPVNLVYDGVPTYRIIDDIAGRLFLVIGFDHQGNQLTWNLPSNTETSVNRSLLQAMNPAYLLAGGAGELNPQRLPAMVKVWFQVYNADNPNDPFAQRNYVSTVNLGSNYNSGLTVTIHGAQTAVYSGGSYANQSTLDTIAQDLAGRWLNFANIARETYRYAGVWPIQPDGAVRCVEWISDADGARTILTYGNFVDGQPDPDIGNIMEPVSGFGLMPMGGMNVDVSPGGVKYVMPPAGLNIFPVIVSQSGGADGSVPSTFATWTYNVYAIKADGSQGTQLNTASSGAPLPVQYARIFAAPTTKATNGMAYYRGDGSLILQSVDEGYTDDNDCSD